MEVFSGFGLGGMFVSAFLAATVLPLSSEIVLGVLLASGYTAGPVVAAATSGNVLGALVNYWIGIAGTDWLVRKVSRVSEADIHRARERFRSWGTGSLLLAWVPVIGDPLTVAAGMLRVNVVLFLFLVTAGKLARYLVLAGYWMFN